MSYQIRPGDTLSGIAARYHTTVGALAKLNGIKNVNLIYAGARLRIPGHSTKDTFQPHRPTGTHGSTPVRPSTSGGARGSQRLADAARRVAFSMGGYTGQGYCARGVSRAIESAFGIKVWGNGNQIDNNLPRSKFKELHISLAEALRTPGLVLTWEHTSSRLGSIYGHTAITAGDGHTSYSDFAERYTTNNGRTGLRIFAPI